MIIKLCLTIWYILFQITVNAYDLGEPSLSSTAQVTVNVVRNNNAPVFQPPQYAVNIDFTTAVDEVIETVQAVDRDSDVSRGNMWVK